MKTKIKKLSSILFSAILLLELFSCATTKNFKEDSEGKFSKLDYQIFTISLEDPDLIIVTNPKKEGFTPATSVKVFAQKKGCFAAINTNPFITERKNPFSKVKPAGIYRDCGITYSESSKKYACIAFFKEEEGFKAQIFKSQEDALYEKAEIVLGGFWQILDGEKIYSFKDVKDFRSAAGLSRDGKTLYLFSGKKLSYMQCAEILKARGAYSAMQFDGGTSSAVYYEGKIFPKMIIRKKVSTILGFSNNKKSAL